MACAPVSGNPVLAWLKLALAHEFVLWQVAQVVGNAGRFVVWIGGAVVILHVARGAICTGEIEIVR